MILLKILAIMIFLFALLVGGFWGAIGTLIVLGIIAFIISL